MMVEVESERVGVQIAPWSPAADILAAARRLGRVVDLVWIQDQMLARNVYTLLAGVAATGEVGVGTNVTFPFGRNPVEIAASMATLAELVGPTHPVVMGMGTGGALVNSLFARSQPISVVRESIALVRRLWAAEAVPLDEYPALGAALGFRPGAVARLTFPVARPIPVLLAGIGPRILELAGEVADGIISASNFPTHSYAAFKSGKFDALAGLDHVRAGRGGQERPFRMVFGLNCCVSRDRLAAKAFARRQLALVAGNPALWPGLEAVGLDVESARDVKAAFERGEGIEGGVARMSDSLLDGLIVSGDPDECLARLDELRSYARAAGYTEFYLGAPLGPDLAEAASIIADVLVPQLWPSRLAVPA
jgi:alkanesulfonate monooxygenase SsuD/methylene tetrahydromethanopterin reductase-like flavin-dependent oxidoreductase (luciferase family)